MGKAHGVPEHVVLHDVGEQEKGSRGTGKSQDLLVGECLYEVNNESLRSFANKRDT